MADYNGWSNYETWAVNLWMDNEQASQEYWRETARECWEASGTRTPNQFVESRSTNAQILFAARLKDEHDEQMPNAIQRAVDGTVYADLLNAALGEVNWHEIADTWLENAECDGYEPQRKVRS